VTSVRGEAWHAARHEYALQLEDWFLRRSRHAYATCNGLDAIEAVAKVFALAHGWDAAHTRRETEACRTVLEELACRPPAAAASDLSAGK
jgi:glycerol-3-phosphate dehydrogenase